MIVCICGAPFEPPARKRGLAKKYCSQRCNVRAWRARNPERRAAIDARSREKLRVKKAANPEIWKAREAARYAADPAKHRARRVAYHVANREKENAAQRASYAADPVRHRGHVAKHRATNRGRVNAAQRAAYAANPEKARSATRRWQKAHREQVHHQIATRRARRFSNGGSHTLTQWREKCDLYLNRCAYCGEARKLTRDHKIPLSCGGTDDISNIIPACASCNARKKTKTAFEFAAMMVLSNQFAGAFRPA